MSHHLRHARVSTADHDPNLQHLSRIVTELADRGVGFTPVT
jgi:hypothetical protein